MITLRGQASSAPTISKKIQNPFPSRGFLTYGSACQDCGFNNQRIDLEYAVALAAVLNRTLVVRNVVCSPHHSPCPWANQTKDGIIHILGYERWRQSCNMPGLICDKDHYHGKTHSLDARLFFDAEYLNTATSPRGFIWQDTFEIEYPHLHMSKSLDDGTDARSRPWPIIVRRGPTTQAELDAEVVHASHLHKGHDPSRLLTTTLASELRKNAKLVRPVLYSASIRSVAQDMVNLLTRTRNDGNFACVHARLGDWLDYDRPSLRLSRYWNGHAYATVVRKHIFDHSLPLFVATNPENYTDLEEPLGSRFPLLANASAIIQKLKARGIEYSNDFWSCAEQFVCEQAVVFVGTKGSTVSRYVYERRSSLGKKSSLLDMHAFAKTPPKSH